MHSKSTILTSHHHCEQERSLLARFKAVVPVLSESFWFCLSLLLFLIMGPFSAIAVLIGLFSLAREENRQRMVEPAGV